MVKRHLATVLAMALVAAGSAWGYGVEGWPNGAPDHVIKASDTTQHVTSSKAHGCCDGCKKGDKQGSSKK